MLHFEFDRSGRLFSFQRLSGNGGFRGFAGFFSVPRGLFLSKLGVSGGAFRLAFSGPGLPRDTRGQSRRALFDSDGIVVSGSRAKFFQRSLFCFRGRI